MIASNFGASALRMGSTSTSCFGVSFSCCATAFTFASALGDWPGAAGARIRNVKRQPADVRIANTFLMAASCLTPRDSHMGPKSYESCHSPKIVDARIQRKRLDAASLQACCRSFADATDTGDNNTAIGSLALRYIFPAMII